MPQGRAPVVALGSDLGAVTVDMERGVLRLERDSLWIEVEITSLLFGKRRDYVPVNGVRGCAGVSKADGYTDVKRATLVVRNGGSMFRELRLDVTQLLL